MASIDTEVIQLENALRAFVQTIKRPQQWAYITNVAGVQLDRPAAMILQTLILHNSEQLGVQDLALLLGIEPPSVSRKAQQLEYAGYLRRQRSSDDRRAVRLQVTAAGHEVADRLWHAQRSIMSQVLQSWPSSDRHRFVSLFARFAEELNTQTKDLERTTIKKGI
jgi:DNA-binding MarR family transcriptional regulator